MEEGLLRGDAVTRVEFLLRTTNVACPLHLRSGIRRLRAFRREDAVPAGGLRDEPIVWPVAASSQAGKAVHAAKLERGRGHEQSH